MMPPDDGARGDSDADDGSPEREGARAGVALERVRERRERRTKLHGSANALYRARCNENGEIWSQAAEKRGESED
jgi:hypothetical protein